MNALLQYFIAAGTRNPQDLADQVAAAQIQGPERDKIGVVNSQPDDVTVIGQNVVLTIFFSQTAQGQIAFFDEPSFRAALTNLYTSRLGAILPASVQANVPVIT